MSCNICQAKAKQIKEGWNLEIGIDAIAEILHRKEWCTHFVPTSAEEEIRNTNYDYIESE